MLKALKSRLHQGYRTGAFPPAAPNLPEEFRGLPEILPCEACAGEGSCEQRCRTVCPTGAIACAPDQHSIQLDVGKCIFCNRCKEACPEGRIHFSPLEYRLAAMRRERLIRSAADTRYEVDHPEDPELHKECRRSLKIRQLSAGGCGACELDFNVLNTLAWDMGRFGIQAVASPRHADVLLITGPVSENMLLALRKTYDAMPSPKWVIACGACAISGGIYASSPVVRCGAESVLKVDCYVPGCPPHPATLLEALLRLMGRM